MGAAPTSVLAGLIGNGIQASRTPAMHEHEGDAQGLRLLYQKIDLEKLGLGAEALPELLTAAERMGFSGLNITHPCKQAVLAHLDELSPDAAALGAVNTVVLREAKRVGHNTDWWGFAEAFRRGLPDVALNRVVQLGAGGAGAAVAHALLTLGVRDLVLNDIDPARAAAVAASLCERFGAGRARACTDLAAEVAAADGLVHCTPTGMDKYPGLPLPAEYLHPGLFVAEIVYFPLETALLREARRIGCRTLDGGGMAVFQAVEAFRLITGLTPDPERMLRHFAELGRTA
ncbi:shikimate dehydrogenase [Methylobacterium platani]|uniref:Shikimate dehydrogenase (NADP(+)) n=2 Tax=Methylobacterium platani TaxID=427683 RepID=A0A179S148_9HYPH|nr:shikimate dehydrogenase [Methylobacterium platani]KMO22755.1 shikimate dehydrogenase [Methylobacterium platani JCM 14648]OAS16620.1 shikimate dehydrogenase [Methylobacterium platani]